MAQLLVRDLPDQVKDRLKRRAATHGRSLEAEVRDILLEASKEDAREPELKEGLGTRIQRLVRESGVANEDVDELQRIIAEGRMDWQTRPIDFGK